MSLPTLSHFISYHVLPCIWSILLYRKPGFEVLFFKPTLVTQLNYTYWVKRAKSGGCVLVSGIAWGLCLVSRLAKGT